MGKGFGNSIGGAGGSGNIDMNSIGLSEASGGPVGGYSAKKQWGASGRPCPEYGAGLQNTGPVRGMELSGRVTVNSKPGKK